MLSVVLLGTGNLAHHLFSAFLNAKAVNVVQVYGRSAAHLESFAKDVPTTTDLASLEQADVYLLAIKDDSIAEVSQKLNRSNTLVVHTSGSVSMDALATNRKGVFYPLQSFSKDRAINFKEVPICLEAGQPEDLNLLQDLANKVSTSVHLMNSEKRRKLHLAAVFINNFTNHLYQLGEQICEEENIPFNILYPLIQETAKKVAHLSPRDAQTGPAKRNDQLTMKDHLDLLKNPIHKEIYQLVSESIRRTHEEKL
ncbi:MAG: DUF2520 domain-containing protein [Allomuricauda sp.]|nr:MAG: DUF2520 domain-containing protein [Allomuricauda sp.]